MLKTTTYLFVFIIYSVIQCQNFDFGKMSFGLSAQYSIPSNDLKEYWDNYFCGGLVANYNLSDEISLETSFLFSINNSIDEKKYPNIYLIEIPAGVKYNFLIRDNFKLFIESGLQSSTFAFRGESAESVKENDNESEMGIFAVAGIHFKINENIKCELFGKILNIFSKPEEIQIISLGINIFLL
ncbi:MAG: outer membrane beta-barrel protein [Ignavibacteriales bacterium]|nr:outer membrane beta-barrel protein [Ignavibacteriales bacterium]